MRSRSSLEIAACEQHIGEECDRFLHDRLTMICRLLTVSFLVAAISDLVLVDHSDLGSLVSMSLGTFLFFASMSWIVSRSRLNRTHVNLLTTLTLAVVLMNLLTRETIISSPFNLSVLAMLTGSIGVLFLSTRWFIGNFVGCTLACVLTLYWIEFPNLWDYLTLQMSATIFAVVLHIFWIKTFSRLAQLRLSDEQHTAELKEVAARSRENEEKFRRMSESIPFGIFQVDDLGFCQYSNNIYRSIFVSAGVKKIEHRWVDALPEEIREEIYVEWLQAAEQFTSFHGVYHAEWQPGDPRWLEIQLSPVFSDGGAVFVGTIEDVTEKKLAQDRLEKSARDLTISKAKLEENSQRLQEVVSQLERARAKAEQSAESKSQFLANMSHEIRTPMTAILGYTDVMLGEQPRSEDSRDYLSTIKRNGEHLLQIINDVLDISKIEAGKLETEIIASNMAGIVAEVYEMMSVRAQEKGIDLRYEFTTPLPEIVFTDPMRLKQILLNLISNAIKFTQRGSVLIAVRTTAESSDDEPATIRVDVKDSGIGMTQQQQDMLFEPFTQADSTMSRRFGGTGLGLTISKRLADKLGCKILVESEFKRGSTFTLQLPVGDAAKQKMIQYPGNSLREPGPDKPAFLSKYPTQKTGQNELDCRILLAEDGVDNQKLIAFLLKKAGATVTIAENGAVAVDKVLDVEHERPPFDLVLMDMQMPVMDGYTATRTLRNNQISLPIIALTAHAMAGDREKCLQAGCDEFITKPINRKKLIQTIQRFTFQHSAKPAHLVNS